MKKNKNIFSTHTTILKFKTSIQKKLGLKLIQLFADESYLIAQAVANNRKAQHELYQKFAPKMLRVCRQYIKDLHDAEEVMLTAFLKVFMSLHKFENKGSFEGWIRRIMVHECLSALRSKKPIVFIDDVTISEEPTDDADQSVSYEDVQHCLDQLPEGYKVIFTLYAIEGYKHHEIAKMLQISEGTSKSQLSHARKALQNLLTQQLQSNYGSSTI